MAKGVWNMLALAVLPGLQGQGCGAGIVAALEAALAEKTARMVIANTSGTDRFSGARASYIACAYENEARIRDFWAVRDDKVTFRKAIG